MAIVASCKASEAPTLPSTTSTTTQKTAILAEVSEALRIPSTTTQQPKEYHSLLLSIPAELRSAIYTAALFDNDKDLSLLRTCKQIYMEASPALYQRPVSFSSQAKLTSWVERSQESDLKRVRTLSLRLTDIDMSSLFDAGPGRMAARPTAWSLYQRELENLDKALQSLSGLRSLTVVPPERNNSQLLRAMYLSFLAMIPALLPALAQLTVHDDEGLINKVPSLKQFSNRARVVFDVSKSRRGSDSSSSKYSTDWDRSEEEERMMIVDGVAIKVESMDED